MDKLSGAISTCTDNNGQFVCRMAADDAGLTLTLEVAESGQMERMQGVVIDHLKRFAFREDLGEVNWTAVG